MLIDDDEIDVLAHLHPKTDFGEGCVPGRLVTWFLEYQTQFPLRKCGRFRCYSRSRNRSETLPAEGR